jgi:hypothetical protein
MRDASARACRLPAGASARSAPGSERELVLSLVFLPGRATSVSVHLGISSHVGRSEPASVSQETRKEFGAELANRTART